MEGSIDDYISKDFMRYHEGGTSKGVLLWERDLPEAGEDCQKIVTYDLARQMEWGRKVKCSEFASTILNHL
jgi:hypothetical protein